MLLNFSHQLEAYLSANLIGSALWGTREQAVVLFWVIAFQDIVLYTPAQLFLVPAKQTQFLQVFPHIFLTFTTPLANFVVLL